MHKMQNERNRHCFIIYGSLLIPIFIQKQNILQLTVSILIVLQLSASQKSSKKTEVLNPV